MVTGMWLGLQVTRARTASPSPITPSFVHLFPLQAAIHFSVTAIYLLNTPCNAQGCMMSPRMAAAGLGEKSPGSTGSQLAELG